MRAALSTLFCVTLFACSSAPKKVTAPAFAEIIASAEELRDKGSTDRDLYGKINFRLIDAVRENPKLSDDEANQRLAKDFLAKQPGLTCPLEIKEPDETYLTAGGFLTPLTVSSKCAVQAPFTFEADSADIALSPEGFSVKAGVMTAVIRVNSATTEKARNTIKFSARYYAAEFLASLHEIFKTGASSDITFNPTQYTIAREPTVSPDSYAAHRKNFRVAALRSSATAGDLGSEIGLSETGQFSVGGSYTGRKFDLTYGHPNSVLPDGIGTSFTTIRVDGTDYRFEKQKLTLTEEKDGTLRAEAAIGKTGISVIQNLKPEGVADRIKTRISYEIRNNSGKKHDVGIRLMIDTWAGKNDGVPFLLPTGEIRQLYRTEVEFTATAALMWQAYDLAQESFGADPEPALQNILVGKDLVPPDRIALANWPEAVASVWDYAISSERRLTGDSAVILWWNPTAIAPGASQTVATELGAYLIRREPSVFVTNPETGELLIYLWHRNYGGSDEKVSYSVRAERGTFSYDAGPGDVTLNPGATFVQAKPAQILVEGGTTIIITENINGVTKEYKFPVENLKMWKKLSGAPVVEPAKNFPVNYFDERSMDLRARIKTGDGRVLQTIDLKRDAIEGGFQYSGEFMIPENTEAGRYTVEVFR